MNETDPLFQLTAKQQDQLADLVRETTSIECINEQLTKWNQDPISVEQAAKFYHLYTQGQWARRVDLATQEAETVLELFRDSGSRIPEALLAVLGLEAFRKVASGKIKPGELVQYTTLFLRARDQDRYERALDLQTEKANRAYRTATEKALDAVLKELPKNPAAQEAFQTLKKQLLDEPELTEEVS